MCSIDQSVAINGQCETLSVFCTDDGHASLSSRVVLASLCLGHTHENNWREDIVSLSVLRSHCLGLFGRDALRHTQLVNQLSYLQMYTTVVQIPIVHNEVWQVLLARLQAFIAKR